jgi:hypothetical protein
MRTKTLPFDRYGAMRQGAQNRNPFPKTAAARLGADSLSRWRHG